MPDSPALWAAATLLWILDASINVSMEPFRAFVADKLPEEQRTTGFVMQSFFIAVGSVFASLLPWLFARLGYDPALGSGPVATVLQDTFSIMSFIITASLLL